MTHYLPVPVAFLLLVFLTGCGDDVVSPPTTSDVYSTTMTGYQGPSPVASQAWGEARFEVNGNNVDYEVTIEDMPAATMAHIHVGSASESGPVVFGFFTFDEPEDIESETFTGTITESNLMPQEGAGFDGSMDAFLQRLENGTLYVNTHTVYNPANEIRGQIRPGANNTAPSAPSPVSFTASLDGSTEDVTTDAHGESKVTWDWSAREMQYEVTLVNIDNVTQAHVHRGETTGPVATFFSGEVGENLYYTSAPNGGGEEDQARSFDDETLTGTIEYAYFTGGFDGSFQQLLDLLRHGEAFINVHTLEYPGGEIGGQYGNGGSGNGTGGGDPGY